MIYDLNNELDISNFKLKARGYLERKAIVDIKLKTKKRTLSQNSYFYVILNILEMEVGQYSSEEWKVFLKRKYDLTYEKNGQKFLRSSADLSVEEMIGFIEFIISYAIQKHDCKIPSSQYYLENQVVIDRDISRHKKFLKENDV